MKWFDKRGKVKRPGQRRERRAVVRPNPWIGVAEVEGSKRDQLWGFTEFEQLGREALDGRDIIVFSFRTKKKAPPHTDRGVDWWIKTKGRLWIDEEDENHRQG